MAPCASTSMHVDLDDMESECSFITARTSLTVCSQHTVIRTTPTYSVFPNDKTRLTPYLCRTPSELSNDRYGKYERSESGYTSCTSDTTASTCSQTSSDSSQDGSVNRIIDGGYGNNLSDVEEEDEDLNLAELINQKDYSNAMIRAREYPDELRVTVPLSSQSNVHVLPLHLALYHQPLPPFAFTRLLMELYPEAVKQKEKIWGYLPLHLACRSSKKGKSDSKRQMLRNNQYHIVKELLRIYPEAARETESFRGMLPVHMTVEGSTSIGTVQLLIKAYPESVFYKDDFGDIPIDLAKRSKRAAKEKSDLVNGLLVLMTKLGGLDYSDGCQEEKVSSADPCEQISCRSKGKVASLVKPHSSPSLRTIQKQHAYERYSQNEVGHSSIDSNKQSLSRSNEGVSLSNESHSSPSLRTIQMKYTLERRSQNEVGMLSTKCNNQSSSTSKKGASLLNNTSYSSPSLRTIREKYNHERCSQNERGLHLSRVSNKSVSKALSLVTGYTKQIRRKQINSITFSS